MCEKVARPHRVQIAGNVGPRAKGEAAGRVEAVVVCRTEVQHGVVYCCAMEYVAGSQSPPTVAEQQLPQRIAVAFYAADPVVFIHIPAGQHRAVAGRDQGGGICGAGDRSDSGLESSGEEGVEGAVRVQRPLTFLEVHSVQL